MPNIGNESVGLLQKGTIVDYDPQNNKIKVLLRNISPIKGSQALPVEATFPHSLYFNNGLFIGTYPVNGTPVIVGQAPGGEYYFVSFLQESLSNENSPSRFRPARSKIPNLDFGKLLIQSNDNTKITLDMLNSINVGSDINNIHIDTESNYISTNFHNDYNFTQAARKVTGVIKRDTVFNTQFSQELKLENDDYNAIFKTIGLDPTVPPNSDIAGPNKNPPFVENRELIYEFRYLSTVKDDLNESTRYGKSSESSLKKYLLPNRRQSRADTLSLSLVAPNYLMETIKGTVVDIFGNLLDLNRDVLPVGSEQATLNPEKSKDKVKSFLLIKELERRSLAYHFEINARKDLSGKSILANINSNSDYSRLRSRFFLDIDKEGQFKLNVPASSEKGNIPLLTRYENYSTFSTDDDGNPDKLIYTDNNRDIYQDSFASPALVPQNEKYVAADSGRGSIKIIGSDSKLAAAPKDRITEQIIKHGTVYHDILQTCYVHQNKTNQYINYAGHSYYSGDPQANPSDDLDSIESIPPITNIVTDTIVISGANANAGGRSGSLNFDGSVEINIGANTIDRQSLWFDTAGGVVANIGRDINGRSVVAATGGDFFLQVGGFGVKGDSRFPDKSDGTHKAYNNEIKGAILDLRILTDGGLCHMIRCDNKGVTVMTPGRMAIHANGKLEITSNTEIRIASPNTIIQDRVVLNGPEQSI